MLNEMWIKNQTGKGRKEPEDFVGLWSNDCRGENAFRDEIKRFLSMGLHRYTLNSEHQTSQEVITANRSTGSCYFFWQLIMKVVLLSQWVCMRLQNLLLELSASGPCYRKLSLPPLQQFYEVSFILMLSKQFFLVHF